MITIISGTNRNHSRTFKVAQFYLEQIKRFTNDVQFLSLEGFDLLNKNEAFFKVENELLIPAEKFVIIMPEYNGSFPGVLKLLFDQSDIRKCWWHKKVLLTGLADGRGGNLRGLDHLTSILHYLKMNVFYNKLPLSRIREELSPEGGFLKPETVDAINNQIAEFMEY